MKSFMNTQLSSSHIVEKKLDNGLTLLIKPQHMVPEVDIQLWYGVGSKHEKDSQRGMAHLIEHMIFKGTKDLLSECDLDRVVQHFSGYANAFTSYDYTTYVFRFPSHTWEYAFKILADCMVNAKFDAQMLNSEYKAVIQELKMYKDDFKSSLLEKLFGSVIMPHPYHHPIIGYKEDLWNLKRDDLYRFYKDHYFPSNATLVVVGDINPDTVIAQAETYFGCIPSQAPQPLPQFCQSMPDLEQKTVTIARDVSTPWCCYAYKVPGICGQQAHTTYMVSLLLARGKTSRLYKRLVEELKIATEVSCFDYELFEQQLLYITVQPINTDVIDNIQHEINELLSQLASELIPDWELAMLANKAESEYVDLLQSNEYTATTLGQYYLAHGTSNYFSTYIESIRAVTAHNIQDYIKTYLAASMQHCGYLTRINDGDKQKMAEFQQKSDTLDEKILAQRLRTTKIELPKFSASLPEPKPASFTYPKPHVFTISNGLEVYWYHHAQVPKASIQLKFKADSLYDPKERAGLSIAHSRMMLEGTKNRDAAAFHRLIEEKGMCLDATSGLIRGECLTGDIETLLSVICEMCQYPSFPEDSLRKVQQQQNHRVADYWDEPFSYVTQLARAHIYKDHPYGSFILGTAESIASFTIDDLHDYHQTFISPKGATLVIVGDLGKYQDAQLLQGFIENTFGQWQGPEVSDIQYPDMLYQPKNITDFVQRDQSVIAFAAPSISRSDEDYDALALLDIILTGGATGSMSSRLFSLREQTGLFYTIGGSLIHGASVEPGMIFIKTMVSTDMVSHAQREIKNVCDTLARDGISDDELKVAKRALVQGTIGYFENNMKIASSFLFLKKHNFSFDLFDKRGANLSIIKNEKISQLAHKHLDSNRLSLLYVGREIPQKL